MPIWLVALALAYKLLPHSEPKRAERLDVWGVALLSPGLAGVVFGLSKTASSGGIAAPIAWLPIVAGVLCVVAFVRHALRTKVRPLLDLSLFRKTGFAPA